MLRTTHAILSEGRRLRKLVFQRFLKDFLLIAVGVAAASVGLKGFLLPNAFLDGGAMGLALLAEIVSGVELSILIVLINLPFLIIGSRQISKQFALKSAIAILALAVLVHYIEIPAVTNDKLLISIFGGFFLGTGIGLSIRGGAVIDGTEVLAIYVSRRTSLSVGDFIAIFNVVLFTGAIFLLNVETAMYSMLTYFAASKTVDFIINGIEEYIGVTIISKLSEDIRETIVAKLGRGVTVYKSDGGYGKSGRVTQDRNVLFCVVTRLEVTKLIHEVNKLDADAFVIQHSIMDTKGGMIKKRPLH